MKGALHQTQTTSFQCSVTNVPVDSNWKEPSTARKILVKPLNTMDIHSLLGLWIATTVHQAAAPVVSITCSTRFNALLVQLTLYWKAFGVNAIQVQQYYLAIKEKWLYWMLPKHLNVRNALLLALPVHSMKSI